MKTDLYVYYRVKCDDAEAFQSRLLAMQAAVSEQHGVVTALKRRPEPKDGQHTWMEVYYATPDGFERVIEEAVRQAGLADLIQGSRHTEYFLDYSACA
jgi:hypothetical protein